MSAEVIVTDLNDEPEYQRLMQAPQTLGLKAGKVHLKPGADCGRHSTEDKEEILVFLQGWGLVLIGENEEKTFEIGEGKVIYIPPETAHNIKNTGSGPLIYIFVVTPANPS
ncbi:MAG: cupin domain-containing protein [Planctomycetota bacterium]